MKTFNPGKLKTRVEFYAFTKSIDDEGFKVKKKDRLYSTKCSVTKDKYVDNIRSTAKNLDSRDDIIKITIRYNSKIDKNCTAIINGVSYRIKELSNIELRNKFLELLLVNE